MVLAAGSLRHRVTLQKRVLSQDSNGDAVTEWVNVTRLWAEITPFSVKEFIGANAEQSGVDTRIKIRRRADVTAQHRIVHGSLAYDIKGVLPDPDSGLEYLTLPAVAGLLEVDD